MCLGVAPGVRRLWDFRTGVRRAARAAAGAAGVRAAAGRGGQVRVALVYSSLTSRNLYDAATAESPPRLLDGVRSGVTSDRRIKENIKDIEDDVALTQLRLLQPKTYI